MKMSDEHYKQLENALQTIGNLSLVYGNLLHNYAWREHMQRDQLRDILNTDIKSDTRVTGVDFETNNFKMGELKSTKVNRSKTSKKPLASGMTFEFDKQHMKKKQEDNLKYDCLFFTIFDGHNPQIVASVLIRSKTALKSFRTMVKNKHKEYQTIKEKKQADGRKYRNSIVFKYKDIIKLDGCEFIVGNTEISRDQFINLFH